MNINELAHAKGTIARVYYEGEHPDEGHVCVLLVLLKNLRSNNSLSMTFIRVVASPDSFIIGEALEFNKSIALHWSITPTGDDLTIMIKMVGPTFTEYPNGGVIYSGG